MSYIEAKVISHNSTGITDPAHFEFLALGNLIRFSRSYRFRCEYQPFPFVGVRYLLSRKTLCEKSVAFNDFYRPQTKFAKVMFLQVCVCPRGRGGVCGCGGHAWLQGGVHGCRGRAWLQGACLVAGGVCVVAGGMHAWDMTSYGQ